MTKKSINYFVILVVICLFFYNDSYSYNEGNAKRKNKTPKKQTAENNIIKKDDILNNIGNIPNATLVKYNINSYDIDLLLPDNINDYQYINHYPLTAFLFVSLCNNQIIENLSVKDIMRGRLRKREK